MGALFNSVKRFPRREDVENSNRVRMTNIRNAQEHVFAASDGGTLWGTDQGKKLLSNFMAPEVLKLKIGAQVCLSFPSSGTSLE